MHARAGFHALDQPVEHHDAMAAADEFGMHGERVDAALAVLERIPEVIPPDFLDVARIRIALVPAGNDLEGRIIVQPPGDGKLDDIGRRAEFVGLVKAPYLVSRVGQPEKRQSGMVLLSGWPDENSPVPDRRK